MKQISTLGLVVPVISCLGVTPAMAAFEACEETSPLCATEALPCCCPTGGTTTVYTCPDGWTANGTTCRRATTSGEDSNGYYKLTYGTCAGTAETLNCYKAVARAEAESRDDNGMACMCLES